MAGSKTDWSVDCGLMDGKERGPEMALLIIYGKLNCDGFTRYVLPCPCEDILSDVFTLHASLKTTYRFQDQMSFTGLQFTYLDILP